MITDGGDQPNVVPRTASVWYYFRETDYPNIKELWETGDTIAKGAAMMAGVELQPTKVLGSAWPQHFNKVVAETTCANIQKVGLPQWSDDGPDARQGAAEGAEESAQRGAATEARATSCRARSRDNTGGGSDDIGDISWNVPTVTLRYPVEHSRPARAQLGERDLDGHADRAQGRDRRRQGPGDDDARSAAEAPSWWSRRGTTSATCRPRRRSTSRSSARRTSRRSG